MPQVSVIIPVYNVEKYLRQCLDSVINQTLEDIEIICVNDGSTDKSREILNEYAYKDSRIIVIHKENGGLASARNEGLKHVTGKYCHFLDSDDYIEKNLYEYAVKIFENFDIDYFSFSSKSFIDGEGIIQNQQDMDNYIFTKRDGLYDVNFDIGLNTNIHVWNKIFKTKNIKKNNLHFINGLLYEDIYFMWMYIFLSQKAYFEQNIFHHYRIRPDSIMEKSTKNLDYKTGIDHMLNWYEIYKTVSSNENMFLQNYGNLLKLLDLYRLRTKEMILPEDKYKVEILKEKYYTEMQQKKLEIENAQKPMKYSFWENIFSIKNSNDKKYKVITILGIKIKLKRSRKNVQK